MPRPTTRFCPRSGIPLVRGNGSLDLARELAGAEWIVDAILGTGARGEVRSAAWLT